MQQPNTCQPRKRPSLQSDPWWRNTTHLYIMSNLKSQQLFEKNLRDNLNTPLQMLLSKIQQRKLPSQL